MLIFTEFRANIFYLLLDFLMMLPAGHAAPFVMVDKLSQGRRRHNPRYFPGAGGLRSTTGLSTPTSCFRTVAAVELNFLAGLGGAGKGSV